MATAQSPLARAATSLFGYAVLFAVGLLAAGWAALSAATTAYMRANPQVGSVSSSPGAGAVTAALFLGGTALAFLAAGAALYAVRDA